MSALSKAEQEELRRSLGGLLDEPSAAANERVSERTEARWAADLLEPTPERAAPRVMHIPPQRITPSRYAKRLPDTWETKAFKELAADIVLQQGNIQPIKVRPTGPDPDHPDVEFEVVYGHRRHRACLAHKLPVLAVVEHVSDPDLVVQMSKDNEQRTTWSPYERGVHFKLAFDAGLFRSHRQMAGAVGLHYSTLSKLILLGELPEQVVDAFPLRSKILVNWGSALTKLVVEDAGKSGIFRRAAELVARRKSGHSLNSEAVFNFLIDRLPASEPAALVDEIRIEQDGRIAATIRVPHASYGEGPSVQFEPGAVNIERLQHVVRRLLSPE